MCYTRRGRTTCPKFVSGWITRLSHPVCYHLSQLAPWPSRIAHVRSSIVHLARINMAEEWTLRAISITERLWPYSAGSSVRYPSLAFLQ